MTASGKRLRIGLLAPQFPPAIGGMQELARGLAFGLSRTDDVCVYTLSGLGVAAAPFAQKTILVKKDLDAAFEALRGERVDAWCALDAGLIPLAARLRDPFFAYLHGNDLLLPGYGTQGEWSRLVARSPLIWRLARRVRRFERRRRLVQSLPFVRELFTNSGSTARLIDRTYPRHGRTVTVIPPGVDDSFFQQREVRSDGHLEILTVSRLTRQARRKNIDGVLEALARLAREEPGVAFTYVVVGDGDDRQRLEQLAHRLRLAARVQFRGYLGRDELLASFRRADVFVLAPRATAHDVEGFGIVYIEASASGLPVIGSVPAGSTDAIQDGVNGILIRSSSAKEIAEGIARFARERDRFAPAQVRGVAERFRWPAICARFRERIVLGLNATGASPQI